MPLSSCATFEVDQPCKELLCDKPLSQGCYDLPTSSPSHGEYHKKIMDEGIDDPDF